MKQQGKIQIGNITLDGEIEYELQTLQSDMEDIRKSLFNSLANYIPIWEYGKSPLEDIYEKQGLHYANAWFAHLQDQDDKTIESTISPVIDETHQLTEGRTDA